MSSASALTPSVWLPAIRAGTGADVFTQRLCDGLNATGVRASISWLPHHAEYLPWTVGIPTPPEGANIAHVNSWLPRRFWPRDMPVVVTVHHLVHDPAFRACRSSIQRVYHDVLIRPREMRAIREADVVTTVSDYVRKTVVDFSGRDRISVAHNWIDCDWFRPDRDHASGREGVFRLLMAGSSSRRKGSDLLPAFARALGPGFEIRYAGGHARGIAGVTELGRISKAALICEYQACDAVVSLSRYEGFGYTALEAMACGKPFLGFDASALPEVVTHDCGVLVSVGDVDALAAAARDMRASPDAVATLGAAGRRRALAYFGTGNIEAYAETYARAAGHVRPAA